MTTNRPFNVGIAGLGAGAMNMIPELRANPNAKIVAGADLRPHAVRQFEKDFGGKGYSSVEAMCEDPNVEVVYVMTPDECHAEHAIMAAEHGKQVLADKPMGITLEECDRIIEAVERNKVRIIIGHSQSLDLPNLKMAEIVAGGRLGKPVMIHTMFYSDWIYRPRVREELMQDRGGSIVRRQGPIQVDILRMLGGGKVRSVRATTAVVDKKRSIDGAVTAFFDFEDGHCGTMVYNGYGRFDSSELTFGYTLQGVPYDPGLHARTHKRIQDFGGMEAEEAYKESSRYGGAMKRPLDQKVDPNRRHAFFGFTVACCERGDLRQTPTGIRVYTDDGIEEVDVPAGPGYNRRYGSVEVDEMHRAWSTDTPVRIHDAYWGRATQEVVLGIIQSANERREVFMRHQVPYKGMGVS